MGVRLTLTGRLDPATHKALVRRAMSPRERLIDDAAELGYRLFFARVAAQDAGDFERAKRIWALEAKAGWRLRRRCYAE